MMLALLLLLFQEEPRRDPWAGFGVGSWVILSWSDSQSGDRREKVVVSAIIDGVPKRETFVEEKGEFKRHGGLATHHPGSPPSTGLKETASRSEEFDLGGKKIAATVREYEFKEAARNVIIRGSITTTADVRIPYREFPKDGVDIALGTDLLELNITVEYSDFTNVYRTKVLRRDELTIGTRKVACVVEELSGAETAQGKRYTFTGTRWLSDAVPGRIVKLEALIVLDGKTTQRTGVVTDFEVK
jgi:hypothetical protein